MPVLWLGEAACHDRDRVGGKAAYLSQLVAAPAGHAVPPGFCLIPPHDSDPHGVLGEAYAALAARCGVAAPPVAVRSSALDEDGARDLLRRPARYLSQRDRPRRRRRGGRRCRASARAPRALAYRRPRDSARRSRMPASSC